MAEPIKSLSLIGARFQFFDGSSLNGVGVGGRIANDKLYTAVSVLGATNFRGTENVISDFDAGVIYDKNGMFTNNLKVRATLGDSSSLDVYFTPFKANIPVGKTTSIYVDPHYSGNVDFEHKRLIHSAAISFGATQKVGDKTAVSLELRRYNAQNLKDNSGKNYSANIFVVYNF